MKNLLEQKKTKKQNGFIAWLKKFTGTMLFFAIFIYILSIIAAVLRPEKIPAKIEKVYYTSDGNPAIRTTPCNAYYIPFLKSSKRYTQGITLRIDKQESGYYLMCHSGLQTGNFGHDYYSDWRDSMKYKPHLANTKHWIPFRGKYLTCYFESGDSLKLFPYNNKIYYDNERHESIYTYYRLQQKDKYQLTHNNIVRMKMDAVFDKNQIRKELREELSERFDLVDNYKLPKKIRRKK